VNQGARSVPGGEGISLLAQRTGILLAFLAMGIWIGFWLLVTTELRRGYLSDMTTLLATATLLLLVLLVVFVAVLPFLPWPWRASRGARQGRGNP
jgi:hypothetical protein